MNTALHAAKPQHNFLDPHTLSDPYELYKRLRSESPVFKVHHPELKLDLYLVTTYPLIQTVGGDPELYSSDFGHILFGGGSINPEADRIIATAPCEPAMLLVNDDPVHKRRRLLVGGAFTPRMIAKMTASIEDITDSLIDTFIEKGECDFIREFAIHLPTYMIADIMGIPREFYDRVTHWSDAIILRVGKMATKEQEIAAAHQIVEFRQFILSMVQERRANPRPDDLLSAIINAETNGEPPLTDLEILSFAQEVLVAGNETTRNTLIGGLVRLIKNPAQLKLLLDEPTLAANAVDEILRLETPASAMWRIATRDTTLAGTHIPKGGVLLMRYDSANRDENQFKNGEEFDIRRPNARTHLAFSYGIHHCLGQNLARKELTLAFPKIITRLRNPKIVEAKSDLRYKPNIMIRAMNELYISFDKGKPVNPRLQAN